MIIPLLHQSPTLSTLVRANITHLLPTKIKKRLHQRFDNESSLKRISSSTREALINGRRSSGFSKAKSPLEANYHPDWNINVQGQQVNLDDTQTFMAGVL